MGKTAIILAQLILFGAVVWASVWIGSRMGRAREAAARQGIDPRWAGEVQQLLRDLLTPPKSDAMASDFVVLPQKLKSRTHQLLAVSEQNGILAKNRRSGR